MNSILFTDLHFSPNGSDASNETSIYLLKYYFDAVKRQRFTNEKLYLRIPTSVDAIVITMQHGRYNAVLLTKIVLGDLIIFCCCT